MCCTLIHFREDFALLSYFERKSILEFCSAYQALVPTYDGDEYSWERRAGLFID
jgi:hypothetical protein